MANVSKKEQGVIKISGWNVAGLKKKIRGETWGVDFEAWLQDKWVVGLLETWIEEEDWEGIEDKLPWEWEWIMQPASRESTKGRAMGGIVLGVKKQGIKVVKGSIKKYKEIVTCCVDIVGIAFVYSNGDGKKVQQILEKETDMAESWIVCGDWNVRIGELEGGADEKGEWRRRCSRDKVVNIKGREWVEWSRGGGWDILNGCTDGDWQGEKTYSSQLGGSVIDYIMVRGLEREQILEMKVEDVLGSDHFPVCVSLNRRGRHEEAEVSWKHREKYMWGREESERVRIELEQIVWEGVEGLEDMERKIKGCLKKKGETSNKRGKTWFDGECKEQKRRIREVVRRWREGRCGAEEITRQKVKLEELCKRKQMEFVEEMAKSLQVCKSEGEIWRKLRINEVRNETRINLREWEEKCKEMCGEEEVWLVPNRVPNREEFREDELNRALEEMRQGKAVGEDQLKAEMWKALPREGKASLLACINQVWVGDRELPAGWRRGTIIPVHKGGNSRDVHNYRGITLMNATYKLAMGLVKKRLEEEAEEKDLLPESQGGFRKGRGTAEQVFTLAKMVEKVVQEKKCMFAVFVDLKAAYDSVPRGKLVSCLERLGVSDSVIEWVARVYKETWIVPSVNGNESEGLRVNVGLRQGCPLSPLLFNLYVSELEHVLKLGQAGGVVMGKTKVWMLAYADDMVLFAKSMNELREVLSRVEKYFDRRGLVLNASKTKWMKFRNKGRRGKEEWLKWKEEMIERVSVFKYLGVWISETGMHAEHVRCAQEKGRKAWLQIERKWSKWWGGNLQLAWRLWDVCVKPILLYGSEVWGVKEWELLEREQLWVLRRTLGLERSTPKAIVLQETNRATLRVDILVRMWKFEHKMYGMDENRLVKRMWMDALNDESSAWKGLRKSAYERVGWSEQWVQQKFGMDEVGASVAELKKRLLDVEIQERQSALARSTYNPQYARLQVHDILPKYLASNKLDRQEKVLLARARCGAEERGRKVWMDEKYGECVLCKNGRDTWGHMANECVGVKDEWLEKSRSEWDWLGEKGKGLKTVKRLVWERQNRRRNLV